MPALRTQTFDEPLAISDVLKMEMVQEFCREQITILSGQGVLDIGTVLGQITKGTATVAAKSGGNGSANGTFVIDATNPVRAGAKVGVYALRVKIVHTTHDYTLELTDPDGFSLGTFRCTGSGASITIDNDIKGAFTDGSTDFAVGDGFDITVAAGSSKWGKAVYGNVDGRESAAGVLLEKVDATSSDKIAVAIARGPAIVTRLGLKFDASYDSEGKKDTACNQLKALGIVTRASA